MLLGSADEQKPAAEGAVEAWARSPNNPRRRLVRIEKGIARAIRNVCASPAQGTGTRRGGAESAQQSHARSLARKGPVAALTVHKQTGRASPRPRLRFAGVYLRATQRAGRGPHGSQTNGSCESATQAPFCRRLPTSHAKGRSRPSRFTNKRVVRVRDPGSVLRAFLRSKGLCWSKREGRIQSAERAMPTHSN
jgi:hypothetical protein